MGLGCCNGRRAAGTSSLLIVWERWFRGQGGWRMGAAFRATTGREGRQRLWRGEAGSPFRLHLHKPAHQSPTGLWSLWWPWPAAGKEAGTGVCGPVVPVVAVACSSQRGGNRCVGAGFEGSRVWHGQMENARLVWRVRGGGQVCVGVGRGEVSGACNGLLETGNGTGRSWAGALGS